MYSVDNTKTPNVGVAADSTCVTTLPKVGTTGLMQTAVKGSVSHTAIITGNSTSFVSAVTVMLSEEPTFTVATINAPAPIAGQTQHHNIVRGSRRRDR
jgi:hypothetical protein